MDYVRPIVEISSSLLRMEISLRPLIIDCSQREEVMEGEGKKRRKKRIMRE